ncbi:helix-turn-helix transcriptional regulator [Clostridium coskatii]|uniref:HTH cro/C1-type domain-containing protein n=1 Tax=Clostridium coskatii TaxID=1705578 RepID=A0A162L5B5_9CLOT|nr:helix-turn-helix domain-containing protein [Clostridium coskatii]OAA91332.1 hypothetical protein WX73_01742 [Clostridium coskatii]OBR93964.1 hypothetical protein CLCOS_21000 [Clostridium coskatii]
MVKNRLKEIRMKEYMMNQKEFCSNVLKMNPRTYSPIERNIVQGNMETAFKISEALNKRIEDIWYEEKSEASN